MVREARGAMTGTVLDVFLRTIRMGGSAVGLRNKCDGMVEELGNSCASRNLRLLYSARASCLPRLSRCGLRELREVSPALRAER